MTERTHDLAAFTALTYVIATQDLPSITVATGIVALGANILGGMFPDIDQPTAGFWRRIPTGSVISRIVTPFLGSHRIISHSILGMILFGIGLHYLLKFVGSVLIVNMEIVWWAFMIGYFSHLVMDTITKEGVPWLFPIPWRIGFPPFKFMRVTTGEMIERGVVFPALLILNGYVIYQNYSKFVEFFTKTITR